MWNDIEILVNDDTRSEQLSVCLGQECGSALYQVDSLLQITSSEKVSVNPHLYACSSRDGSIIVVDRSVVLLDSTGQALQLHIQFDTNVDVVGMCQEKQFLVVGERSGNIHLIHIPSKKTLLTKLQGQIKTAFISTEEYHSLGCQNSVISNLANKIHVIIGVSSNSTFVRIVINDHESMVPFVDLQQNLCLNILSIWDVYSLTLIWDWPLIHIEEFLLTTESDSSSIIISKSLISDLSLMVFALPTMQQLYSLEVSVVSSLVLSGIGTLDYCHLWFEFLCYRSVTLLYLTPRLSRLLHKHKFTEAESFAIQFGLDVELVYKVKANMILEKLASASIGSYGQEVLLDYVNEAKENLLKIQDSQFVVDYCINAPWPLYETAQEMLNYAKVRVVLLFCKPDFDLKSLVCIQQVLRAQARLTTFYGAYGLEKFSGIAWTEFLNNEDILKNILFQLEGGNLSCAQYLWLRHQADFENTFDEKMLESLLNAIHVTVPLKELCLWLKSVVIPFLRRVVPKGQKILAKWLEQGARNLELTDKANWPENGLQMAEIFFTSKNQDEMHLTSFGHDCEEVRRLKKLVNDLQELIDLYRKYNCRLALCDFEKENTTTIVFRMFDKILAPELVPSILDKFIKPYLCEHNLQKDELLLQYIKDLLERCRTRSASVFETAWEAKAIAVIGCISDTDLKFDAVLQIMHGAVVPWSGAVEQLVKQHLEMNHVKVKLLQESYRLMEMKKLLRAYGIRDTNLLKDKLVKYILKQDTPTSLEDALKMVEAYMLPTMEVYILRMIDLIDKERGEESLTLLKSLTIAEAEKVAERLTVWGTLVLKRKADNSEESFKSSQLTVHITCNHRRRIIVSNFNIFLSVEDFGNPTLMSTLLEKHINAYETDKYLSKSRKEQTTNSKTKDGKLKKCSTESKLYRMALLLQRSEQELGTTLALRALDAGKVEDAVKICRDFYKNHCNKETGRLLFSTCQKLCHMLGGDVPAITPEDMNLPAVIYEMACQAATICSPDLLLDSLELCKYTLAAKEIYRQCQIENYGFTAKTTCFGGDKDPYEEWTYNDFFNEDGIVLDPQIILPVIYETISSLLPTSENKLYPLDSTSLANCTFIKGQNLLLPARTPICAVLQNLMECSQCELALRLIVCSFGSCLQHGISNNMDLSLGEKLHDGNTLAEIKGFLIAMKQTTASIITTSIMTLLHKVFNCRLIDQDLALGYCAILPREDTFNKLWGVINNTWQNYRKVLSVALVGAQLAIQYGEAAEEKKFRELITDAEWGIQLGKFGVSLVFIYYYFRILITDENKNNILSSPRTFMLDSDAALQLCIETLLLKNANRNHVEDDSAEYSEKQSHYTLLARVLEIIPLLKSPNDLVTSLSGILYKLDPYDYETIEIVLKVIQNADERNTSIQLNQALSLLKHLESYKRISPPVDLEHQYVSEHMIPLSPASETRLPFHLIFFRTAQCFWNIISAELSEESFPTLLLISKLMKVSLDTLHMSAAQHIFQKKLKPKIFEMRNTGYTSVVNKETTKTVQTIQSYLLSIINPEWAVAMAHKIAQEFPTGPDQIQALKFCLRLAEKWLKNTTAEDESHKKAEVLQKKLYMQYKRSATENVLITYKLNTAEYLKSIAKPANLIVLLYEHHSIDQRIQNPTGRDYPDIHMAAKEIAEINNLDMNKILNKLLNKWLCPNTLPSEVNIFGDAQEDEELRRVIYLLQSHPMDYSSRMLFAITTSATSPIGVNQLTFAHRSRALKCLLYLADTSTVESLFKKPIKKVKYFLKCFVYLAEFEVLNIPYTYESFHKSPKEGMIKGLWKNHSHEPTAVRLVTELSLEYKVYDFQLWNGLLQKLLGFNMIHYLKKVLIAITGIHSLWQQLKLFTLSWLLYLSASCPPSPKQIEECCECFVILCPVLADLDVIGIAKQYAQLDLPAFALGCLMLIPQFEKREQQIQAFLSTCNTETVLQQIDEHMNAGEVVAFASQIRSLILDSIINEKLYEKFLKTKYFPLVKQQLMSTHRMKELVNKTDDALLTKTESLLHFIFPPPDLSDFRTAESYFGL
uniref:Kinetochore associated 1 n=1 Tax=Meleagris gallopavo TaxID=9103 RepID=A0A803XMT4_MELGA